MSGRPILLTVVAILAILAGVIFLAVGAFAYTMSLETWTELITNNPDLFKDMTYEGLSDLGMQTMILGIIPLIVGIALFMGWGIAWYIAVIALVAELIFSAYTMYSTGTFGGILTVVIALIILLYLFTPKVKEHFGIGQ